MNTDDSLYKLFGFDIIGDTMSNRTKNNMAICHYIPVRFQYRLLNGYHSYRKTNDKIDIEHQAY